MRLWPRAYHHQTQRFWCRTAAIEGEHAPRSAMFFTTRGGCQVDDGEITENLTPRLKRSKRNVELMGTFP